MKTVVDLICNLEEVPEDRGLYFHHYDTDTVNYLSYRQIYRLIKGAMRELHEHGIGVGSRVIVPFETSERTLISFLSLIALGALPFSIKPWLRTSQEQEYRTFLHTMAGQFKASHVLDTGNMGRFGLEAVLVAAPALDATSGSDIEFHAADPDDMAFVQFSSGTTSFPKGVPIRHDRLIANMQGITGHDNRTPGDISSSWLPLYHDMGLLGGLLSSFILPNTAHLYTPEHFLVDPIQWLHEIGTQRITGSVIPNFGVDYALRYLRRADADQLKGLDLSGLRIIYIGSEPIDMAILDEFSERLRDYGFRRGVFQPCYGMAEAVLMVAVDDDGPKSCALETGGDAVCVGKILSGFSVRIVTEDNEVAPAGELGEIQLSGGTLADAYFEIDRPLIRDDGFYATGDIGMMHDGELYIAGRVGDCMIVNGQNYYAYVFEQILCELAFVRPGRNVVFQLEDRIVVLVEVSDIRALLFRHAHKRRIRDMLLARTGLKVREEDVIFARHGQIKKTSSGKIRRHQMMLDHERGLTRESGPWGYILDRVESRTKLVLWRVMHRFAH